MINCRLFILMFNFPVFFLLAAFSVNLLESYIPFMDYISSVYFEKVNFLCSLNAVQYLINYRQVE